MFWPGENSFRFVYTAKTAPLTPNTQVGRKLQRLVSLALDVLHEVLSVLAKMMVVMLVPSLRKWEEWRPDE